MKVTADLDTQATSKATASASARQGACPIALTQSAPVGRRKGLSKSLAQEVAGFGIKVTLIEPGGYSTDWGGVRPSTPLRCPPTTRSVSRPPTGPAPHGDPVATRDAVLTLVDSDNPPLQVFFGEAPLVIATPYHESRLATWNQWQPLSVAAHGGKAELCRTSQRRRGSAGPLMLRCSLRSRTRGACRRRSKRPSVWVWSISGMLSR